MKVIRRTAALGLVFALTLLLLPAAHAAGAATVKQAEALHALGLFQGRTAVFDEAGMDLNGTVDRIQSLVMFVRLLGAEADAKAQNLSHPFTDVPAYAAPHTGYAAANGLVEGIGNHQFDSYQSMHLRDYVTLILRAAGYSEASGDFQWVTADETGLTLGLYDEGYRAQSNGPLNRGDLVSLSYAALSLPLKDSTRTLAGKLADEGAVDDAKLAKLGIPTSSDGSAPNTPTTPDDATLQKVEQVVALVNQARAAEGLSPLVLDNTISSAATVRAQEIKTSFSHTRPDGRSCFTVLKEFNVSYRAAGENIAYGYATPEQVMTGWLNSPGHRANILNSSFGRIGVGLVGTHWVQLFAN